MHTRRGGETKRWKNFFILLLFLFLKVYIESVKIFFFLFYLNQRTKDCKDKGQIKGKGILPPPS